MSVADVRSRIEWRFDDQDGNVFKRFRRELGLELWLVGWEVADNPDDQAGSKIRDLEGEWRNRAVIVLPFALAGPADEETLTIIEQIRAHAPAFPPIELLESLWRRCKPNDYAGDQLTQLAELLRQARSLADSLAGANFAAVAR